MNRKESKRKSRVECPGPASPSPGKIRSRQSRRRMTCPTPREINTVMASLALGELTKTCSLEQLIEKCLNSFDLDGSLCRSDYMVNMTLTVHSWVVPSADLARCLLALYREASGEDQMERRQRICNFVRYWTTHHPEAFRLEPQLEETMGELWLAVQAKAHGQCQPANMTHVWTRKVSYQSSPSCSKKRKVSLLFDHLDAAELAEHLSYLEFKAFCRISYVDYRSYVLQGSVRENLALERSVALCNSISQWVQVMILNRPTPQQRAEVFTKFIRVTQKLRQLQNFNTLMAVLGGLCHSTISRLKDTHALLPQEVTKTLAEMTELLSSCCNYSTYRRAYGECSGFKIPIVGVHLKDLVSLHEALPDRLGGQLNLSKLQGLYQQAQELQTLQQATPPFAANKDLVHLLTLSLDLYYTDDEIYELSYAREPRCPKSLPATPFKPPVVVEWAPGVAPKPDRLTISKHVQQMVESVFKNYDHDQRGCISPEDFEKIVASFPFSYYGLGKDREGPYSRQEITDYFMRACAIFSKLGLGFLHDFQEATFKKPTFCHSCNGFVSDPVPQCPQQPGQGCPKSQTCQRSCPLAARTAVPQIPDLPQTLPPSSQDSCAPNPRPVRDPAPQCPLAQWPGKGVHQLLAALRIPRPKNPAPHLSQGAAVGEVTLPHPTPPSHPLYSWTLPTCVGIQPQQSPPLQNLLPPLQGQYNSPPTPEKAAANRLRSLSSSSGVSPSRGTDVGVSAALMGRCGGRMPVTGLGRGNGPMGLSSPPRVVCVPVHLSTAPCWLEIALHSCVS
ncbi:RAS guanyl-releasing protein 4 isoform X2 [Gopherus evgoodei]|uniref:RAS guanyl-releasing protein 4 isoform X2 n=1 Tax=Gopherus evgoodei TaxID=1825980 RepID=UPI0011CFDE91|nr:RAS guanyl-releasing protein 4 isoform X2 [Gopherus evgoodei]